MRTRWSFRAWWFGLLLILALATSCNRLGAASDEEKASAGKPLPFGSGTDVEPNGLGETSQPVPPAQAGNGLPFGSRPRVLPSGTLITVRLEHPLDNVHAGDVFTAVVAERVAIDGDILVSRGTAATGAIESAVESSARQSAGYIMLTLTSLDIEGKQLPLQTSSLFAPRALRVWAGQPGDQGGSKRVRLAAGRRLTFRLNVPAALDHQDSVANGEYSLPHAR
jgi:hypothetical protein